MAGVTVDIFTTVLTKVRATPIKPEKLKVKALNKESGTSELTDDLNHLEDHDLYFINEKRQSEEEAQPQDNTPQAKPSIKDEHEFTDENIVPSTSVITDKQEVLHPHKSDTDDDPDIKHFDTFV
jgi:hypothetical protein